MVQEVPGAGTPDIIETVHVKHNKSYAPEDIVEVQPVIEGAWVILFPQPLCFVSLLLLLFLEVVFWRLLFLVSRLLVLPGQPADHPNQRVHHIYYGSGEENHQDFLEALICRVPLGRVYEAQIAMVGILGCTALGGVEQGGHLEALHAAVLSEQTKCEECEVLQCRVVIPS